MRLLAYVGEISTFLLWQIETFGALKIFSTKQKLYKVMLQKLQTFPRIEILEFGVAHGFTTKFLIQQIEDLDLSVERYIGFDTFEGLDQRFRNFPKGAFDNGGKFPRVSSEYLYWSKGFVQETLPAIKLDSESTKLWIFDLDLYDATHFVVMKVIDLIQIGDICYFDEAFDVGEFKLINEILLFEFEFDYIGTNGQGLALQVKGKKVG